MASAIYPEYKQFLLEGAANTSLNVDDATNGPFCALIDTADEAYNAADSFFSDITGAGIIGTDQRITAPTVANGLFDGADLTYTAVTGDPLEALIIYRKNSGANTTWKLVCFIDGISVTPNGGNITVTFNASGIAQLSDGDVKENVRKVGVIGVANVYSYNYRGQQSQQVGFIAQEIEQFAPVAVCEVDGRKRVDYAAAVVGALKLAA